MYAHFATDVKRPSLHSTMDETLLYKLQSWFFIVFQNSYVYTVYYSRNLKSSHSRGSHYKFSQTQNNRYALNLTSLSYLFVCTFGNVRWTVFKNTRVNVVRLSIINNWFCISVRRVPGFTHNLNCVFIKLSFLYYRGDFCKPFCNILTVLYYFLVNTVYSVPYVLCKYI
jgi:hypothetical protein